LYCQGKENGVNILKSIDEGPYQMGRVWEPLAEGTEGAPQLGPERPRVYSDMSPEEKDRYNVDIRATNILLQGLPKDIYTPINHYTDAKDIWENVKMLLEGSELTKEDQEGDKLEVSERIHEVEVRLDMREFRTELRMLIRVQQDWLSATTATAQENGVALDTEQLLFLAGGQDNAFDDDVDEQPVQDLALNVDNMFQADDCDAFDSDVDEASTAQTTFMANLSSTDPVTDEAGPSYDLNILSEMIYNDMCEPHAQSVSNPSQNLVVENSLTTELATYKEQVELPKPYYNELNKIANGYKNPLCLTRAKQVQPALYNGHEILKDNHILAIVHNTEDTLEIAKIIRRKINDKIKDPKCVTGKVKIAPHDYSKENFLATFTPQKQLTPEQIFWSQDLIKLKSEALKGQTTVSRPIKALTVGLYQLGSLRGKRGFEQTKECYLKEVIPFFKTLKDNFEGIQKAPTNEIKEMKDVFEELEAEVAQNVIDRKHDAIERKNLLIANDNLIAECLSKEVFYVATNSELNVARFTEMHVANTIVEARCMALEAELANLHDKSQHDNQEELINHFPKLE
nr:hypothetical protein [Tanacetum cinerariifolium]